MKRIYQIEIDTRDFEGLYAYRLDMEQQHPLTEEHMIVHDVLWQITEQEIDRQTERNYEASL
tara:strand:+ start:35 stop:220 length:186 start_codon:yes stop_codon:yes gene_type:complete